MAGLFDTLALGSRSLSTYRQAIDTSGHNLANVNTPGYTRQRVSIQAVTGDSVTGAVGAGSEVARVERLQSDYFNQQVQVESSIQGSLETRQDALEHALTALQESVDRNQGAGTATSGISQGLADFFAGMQSVSTNPSSIPERQVFLQKAQVLASRFNQVDARLAAIGSDIDKQVTSNVTQVNSLTNDIAKLNAAIVQEEAASGGSANDLRDSRQLKLEELSHLVKVDSAEQSNGAINVMVSGTTLVEGVDIRNTLETFDSGSGVQVRIAGQVGPLGLTGGALEGSLTVRDSDITEVRAQVNDLAAKFIAEVNKLHTAGFSLTGSTGTNLFTGANAGDIQVNTELLGNPALLQASSVAGETGNNDVARSIAQLASAAQSALQGQSFSDRQAEIVAGLGQKVATAQTNLEDQKSIASFVQNQRESIAGVSMDEEMANLVMFQKAFQASAKLISMTDELLSTIIQM